MSLMLQVTGELDANAEPGTMVFHQGSVWVFDWDHWVCVAPEQPMFLTGSVEYPAGAPVPSWWDASVSPKTNRFCDGLVLGGVLVLVFFIGWLMGERRR